MILPPTHQPHNPSYQGIAYPLWPLQPAAADIVRTILVQAEKALGDTVVAGRTPALAGWQIGQTKVFLKFWHLDALAILTKRQNEASYKLQVKLGKGGEPQGGVKTTLVPYNRPRCAV